MRFEFATAGKIVFGRGAVAETGKIAAGYGHRCMLVHGTRSGPALQLQQIVENSGCEVELYRVDGEPELELIRDLVTRISSTKCSVVISIGGGSVLDAGKAAAGLANQPGDVLDYLEVIGSGKVLVNTPLPFIAIPTTSGTGSEVTKNAVLSSPEHRLKVSLRSSLLLAKAAVIDPELTLSMPQPITAATGMDAFTQLLEPFVSRKANPIVDGFCREGLTRLGPNLIKAYTDGSDLAAREEMALAALFSGLALANSGLGAAHGLAGPLGGLLNAPHGALCARLIGAVCEVNIRVIESIDTKHPTLERYQEACALLQIHEGKDAKDLVAWINDLADGFNIPRLRDHGLNRRMYPEVIAQAKRASSMQANPVTLEDKDITRILDLAL